MSDRRPWAFLIPVIAAGCGSGTANIEPLRTLTSRCAVEAIWDEPGAPDLPRVEGQPELAVYLDATTPMAGFLPFDEASGRSQYAILAQDLPRELDRHFGTDETTLRWRSFGKSVVDLPPNPRVDRSFFVSSSTDLVGVLQRAAEDVSTGRAEAVAIVSDLVHAPEALTGGPGPALEGWLHAAGVRSGSLALGVAGLKAPYWGASARGCNGAAKGLGCWYSEGRRAWVPLAAESEVPLYVVVLGRGAERVDAFGRSLLELAQAHEVEARWELMTAGAASTEFALACAARDSDLLPNGDHRPQQALLVDAQRGWRCVQGKPVEVACELPPDLAHDAVRSAWEGVQVEPATGGFVATLDCARLRESRPSDLTFELDLRPSAAADGWTGWSSRDDMTEAALGKTLRVTDILDRWRVRGDRYVARCDRLLGSPL